MSRAPDPVRVVDARGTVCPVPIVRAQEAMRQVEVGETIEIIADDPAIEHDLPAWCRSHGHEIVASRREGGRYVYRVRRCDRRRR